MGFGGQLESDRFFGTPGPPLVQPRTFRISFDLPKIRDVRAHLMSPQWAHESILVGRKVSWKEKKIKIPYLVGTITPQA